ncbi:MAG: response regulator [Deltaproteobacteria bacterium]|nr:response regulator [Deltaproteobacteria bacterium]
MTEQKKILVVDDDPDLCDLYRMALEPEGFAVLSAGSAAEGQKRAVADKPDLVILDIMMEEAQSGITLAHWLAREYPQVPVMLLSSIIDAGAQVFDIGSVPAALCVNKPLTPQQLIASVKSLLG